VDSRCQLRDANPLLADALQASHLPKDTRATVSGQAMFGLSVQPIAEGVLPHKKLKEVSFAFPAPPL